MKTPRVCREVIIYRLQNKKIWVAGHNGMVGGALVRRLEQENCEILIVSRQDLDLRRQADVEAWTDSQRPDVVVMAAAKVGGILANDTYPADFLYDNLAMETNVIHAAYRSGVEKLLFLGSSCIYPREAPQPLVEDSLLTGPLEPTNEWYAVAKIAGLKLCQAYRRQYGCDFISAMPCNLYGPGDTYDARQSHVIPALLMKMHEAKVQGVDSVALWGTGTPLREFLYVDDLANALICMLECYSDCGHLNIGSGQDVSISDLASMVADVTGFRGEIIFDPERPDGTPRKLMDSSRVRELGWQPDTRLPDGLKNTYLWYCDYVSTRRQAA